MSAQTIEAVAVADPKGNITLVPASNKSFWDKKFLGIGSLRNGDVAEIAVICTTAAVIGWGVGVVLTKAFGPAQLSDSVSGLTDAMDGLAGGRL
jgi:hypothetical protein